MCRALNTLGRTGAKDDWMGVLVRFEDTHNIQGYAYGGSCEHHFIYFDGHSGEDGSIIPVLDIVFLALGSSSFRVDATKKPKRHV